MITTYYELEYCIVFQSFPDDKENRIFPVNAVGSTHNTRHVTVISPTRPPPKRKVLRKHNGVSFVCNESLSDQSTLSESGDASIDNYLFIEFS